MHMDNIWFHVRRNKVICRLGGIKFFATFGLGLVLWLGTLVAIVPQYALADSNDPTATQTPTPTIAVTLPPTDTPIPTNTAVQEESAAQEDSVVKGLETSQVEDTARAAQDQADQQPWTSSLRVIDLFLIAAIALVGLGIMSMVVFAIIKQQG